MEVIGPEHPADEQECHLLPRLCQRFDKAAAKTLREEKGRAPVSAGGDELQLPRIVMPPVERHDAGEYTCPKASPPENPFGRSQTPQNRGLRQPRSAPACQPG